ncbi:PREDICTED: putative uncharacterized protein CXorf58 homolog, partial [Mesitornis unicolor]|uniref:putative uncharacterized protein CXorf58 homolog n=1 Tax=Mesitornis unicolor TaxID=54374 RepID=UPI000528528B
MAATAAVATAAAARVEESEEFCFSFRLALEFPPFLVFQIFCNTHGQGGKYINRNRILSPSNEATADAYKLMGYQKYHEQMVQEELQYPSHRVTDDNDILLWIWCIALLQSTTNLDESPVYFGGRNNCWRRSLQDLPGTTVIYATTDYPQPKTLSDRLKKELKLPLLRPQNKELWHDQLMATSN